MPDYQPIVLEAMRETRGVSLPNFLSHPVFRNLLAKETAKLLEPSVNLVADIRNFYENAIGIKKKTHTLWFPLTFTVETIIEMFLGDIPQVPALVKQSVVEFLDANEKICTDRIHERLEQESCVFTLNANYMETFNTIRSNIGAQSVVTYVCYQCYLLVFI